MRNKSEVRGFVLRNYLTSNIKNDIRRTKSDFAIPMQGINTGRLFLSQFLPEQPKIVFMDLCSTCDCLNERLLLSSAANSGGDVAATLGCWEHYVTGFGRCAHTFM